MNAPFPKRQPVTSISPFFQTKLGRLFLGDCESVLQSRRLRRLRGKVQLIFTSPPFPLNKKKRYGNLKGDAYLHWFSRFGPILAGLLTEHGSIVVEIGNAWEPGSPVQSVLPYKALIAFLDSTGLKLCQEFIYHNPARLPGPAQWVTIDRIRLKDSTTKIWWMSKTAFPKANNRNVLRPYSERMELLLARQSYNAGRRPSHHNINGKSFLKNNGGAIPSNLLQVCNTESASLYQRYCRDKGIRPHPARMPVAIPEFFIRLLTEEDDIVLDPFAGSNTTGIAAEQNRRRWVSIEMCREYAEASLARFETASHCRRKDRRSSEFDANGRSP